MKIRLKHVGFWPLQQLVPFPVAATSAAKEHSPQSPGRGEIDGFRHRQGEKQWMDR